MQRKKRAKKGFSYHPTDEIFDRFLMLTLEERFRWVIETNQFLQRVATPGTKKAWDQFRRGEI